MSRQGLHTYELMAGLLVILVECSLWCVSTQQTPAAYAAAAIPQENNGQALTPFKGWSTWNFVERVPTAAKVVAQAQALASSGLVRAGYNYVLLDDFYYLNPKTTVDSHGYWVTDTNKFPGGLAALAAKIHAIGLKFYAYLTPGVPVAAVNEKTKIEGTPYTANEIAEVGKYEHNHNYGSVNYYIDYSKPGAQAFINGWAKELAADGVNFLKIDGVGAFDILDVEAWATPQMGTARQLPRMAHSCSTSQHNSGRIRVI